jgi:hypothetical protein
MKRLLIITSLFGLLTSVAVLPQQVADENYSPDIGTPAYAAATGPLVYIDEGHYNFHTKDGRYLPFALLLEKDGYRVEGYKGAFETGSLNECRILVISNALNSINAEKWYLPTPSAFSRDEIRTVKKWVKDGGALFLIADHMPMAGAAADIAAVFGFTFYNGFAVDTTTAGPAFFTRENGRLGENLITAGSNENESVQKVVTFTGQAFDIPGDAESILTFDDRYTLLISDTAWVFDSATKMKNCSNMSQGAFMPFGKGRVAVFGEAAMFTAQLAGPQRVPSGMNSPYAEENYRLLLNIIHWLDGRLQ